MRRKPMATLRHPEPEPVKPYNLWQTLGIMFGSFFAGYMFSHVVTVLRTID